MVAQLTLHRLPTRKQHDFLKLMDIIKRSGVHASTADFQHQQQSLKL